jgi:hypothetical protein|tara:strand:+ start:483 stop:674 length:192 start_codon:yes stop_codon:yes gene_type:complete
MEENIIEKLNLTKKEVLSIVSEWYLSGEYEDILQNENGWELEEILQDIYDDTEDEEKADFEVE